MVDLALPANGALVLLKAKVIEGQHEEIYHNLPYVLVERMKPSLPRAFDQAVNSDLGLTDDLRRSKVYLECVTFKQWSPMDWPCLNWSPTPPMAQVIYDGIRCALRHRHHVAS